MSLSPRCPPVGQARPAVPLPLLSVMPSGLFLIPANFTGSPGPLHDHVLPRLSPLRMETHGEEPLNASRQPFRWSLDHPIAFHVALNQ